MSQPRTYRRCFSLDDIADFTIVQEETDLWIRVSNNVNIKDVKRFTVEAVLKARMEIKEYIRADPEFLKSLSPCSVSPYAPEIVAEMAKSARMAGVGPMAAVAGAISEYVGKSLRDSFKLNKVIVENGGDIYMYAEEPIVVSIYAGSSPFSGRVAVRIDRRLMPVGVCTSSGTVGHSLSFGKADAVTVVAKTASIADAFATAFGNVVKDEKDIQDVLDMARNVSDVVGVVVIFGDKMGVWGDIQLAEV